MGSIHKKTIDRKSRATVPLRESQLLLFHVICISSTNWNFSCRGLPLRFYRTQIRKDFWHRSRLFHTRERKLLQSKFYTNWQVVPQVLYHSCAHRCPFRRLIFLQVTQLHPTNSKIVWFHNIAFDFAADGKGSREMEELAWRKLKLGKALMTEVTPPPKKKNLTWHQLQ